jgi:lipopolysaccharide/colanic/teichoic acid biosynthesis glycosyltransferase
VPLLAADTDMKTLVRRLDIDRVMLAPALTESPRVDLVCELSELGVHVDLVPSWSDVVGARLDLHEMQGMPLLTLPHPELGRYALHLKWALDLLFAGACLLLAPLLIVCAVAIKLDSPGPILFRQRRIGKGDRPFEVFQLRSMYVDADARKDEVAELNFHGGSNDSGKLKISEDPRVTRVGRILRRYSLDELRQLLNILRGEMSLVGPRQLIENEDRQIEGRLRRRLDLTPGADRSVAGPRAVGHPVRGDGQPRLPVRDELVSLGRHQVAHADAAGGDTGTRGVLRTGPVGHAARMPPSHATKRHRQARAVRGRRNRRRGGGHPARIADLCVLSDGAGVLYEQDVVLRPGARAWHRVRRPGRGHSLAAGPRAAAVGARREGPAAAGDRARAAVRVGGRHNHVAGSRAPAPQPPGPKFSPPSRRGGPPSSVDLV